MKDLKKFKNQLEDMKIELKKLNELHDHLNEERYNVWKECSQAPEDYENLKASKHSMSIECEGYKKNLKFSNDKLEQYEGL